MKDGGLNLPENRYSNKYVTKAKCFLKARFIFEILFTQYVQHLV